MGIVGSDLGASVVINVNIDKDGIPHKPLKDCGTRIIRGELTQQANAHIHAIFEDRKRLNDERRKAILRIAFGGEPTKLLTDGK